MKRLCCVAICGVLLGCGSKSADGNVADAGAIDAQGDAHLADGPSLDAAPELGFPAFPPDMPQLSKNAGKVLRAPVIVTVTWPTEPFIDKVNAFSDQLGASKYWRAVTAEYGVVGAQSVSANHVTLIGEPTPKEMTENDVDLFVQSHVGKWPALSEQTVYLVYLPAETKLTTSAGPACATGTGGYHTSGRTDDGHVIYYAIIPACPPVFGLSSDDLTATASHELAEAATDPDTTTGYTGFDHAHLSWDLFGDFQSEDGDACEYYEDSYYTEGPDLPFAVQRQWSNASALAGHDPCVPALDGAYFNVVPFDQEEVIVDLSAVSGPRRFRAMGYSIAAGSTRTFEVGYFSDAPSEGWTIDAVQGGNPMFPSVATEGDVTATVVSGRSGKNGDRATISVTVNTPSPGRYELVTVVSKNAAGRKHYRPILIGN